MSIGSIISSNAYLQASAALGEEAHNLSNSNTNGFIQTLVMRFFVASNNLSRGGAKTFSVLDVHGEQNLVQTKKNGDLVVLGDGFLQVKDNRDHLYYVKSGNFDLNKEGLLEYNGYRLQGYEVKGKKELTSVKIDRDLIMSPKPTQKIEITKLELPATGEASSNQQYTETVFIINKKGENKPLKLFFKKTKDKQWEVECKEEGKEDVLHSAVINFKDGCFVNAGEFEKPFKYDDRDIKFSINKDKAKAIEGLRFSMVLTDDGYSMGRYQDWYVKQNGDVMIKLNNKNELKIYSIPIAVIPAPQYLTKKNGAYLLNEKTGVPIEVFPEDKEYGNSIENKVELRIGSDFNTILMRLISEHHYGQINAVAMSKANQLTEVLLSKI